MKKLLIMTLCAFALTAPLAHAELSDGLMAYYNFDDCSANDTSGNNNNGVKKGVLTCIEGVINKALQFDGASGYINVLSSSTLNPVDQLTMSFWIRVDGIVNDWSPIIHKGGLLSTADAANREYAIWLNRSPYFHQNSAGDQSGQHYLNSKKITKGKWLHYVGIVDRVNHVAKIYINGVLNKQSRDSYSSFNNNNEDLRFGWTEEIASAFSPLKGALDEIRLYNRALSDAEIQNLYEQSFTISGNVKGLTSVMAVTCENTSTGQVVTFASTKNRTFDCEKAGLLKQPQQMITIKISGQTP